MKKITKFLPILILVVFLTSLFFTSLVWAKADVVDPNILKPKIKISIGGFTAGSFSGVDCPSDSEYCFIPWIGEYVGALYQYGVGLAAVLAVVMIMVGGFLWLTSGGSPDRVGKAKEFITSALLGLFLALFSYVILYTINPRLIAMEPLKVKQVLGIDAICCSSGKGQPILIWSQSCPTDFPNEVNISECEGLVNACPAELAKNTIRECVQLCLDTTGEKGTFTDLPGGNYCCICSDDDCIRDDGITECQRTPECCPGLVCNTEWKNRCEYPADEDKPCRQNSDCAGKLICYPSGKVAATCRPQSGSKGPCDNQDGNNDCQSGLYCHSGRCQVGNPGDLCKPGASGQCQNQGNYCFNGWGVGNTCQDGSEGSPCNPEASGQCQSGLHCEDTIGWGGKCTSS